MNVMFVINGKVITPKLTSALLDGVTRDTILTLAPSLGVSVEERKVSVAEIEQALKNGTLTEAFGTGTAAVVSPIATINIHGTDYNIPAAGPGSFQLRAKEKLNVQLGSCLKTREEIANQRFHKVRYMCDYFCDGALNTIRSSLYGRAFETKTVKRSAFIYSSLFYAFYASSFFQRQRSTSISTRNQKIQTRQGSGPG